MDLKPTAQIGKLVLDEHNRYLGICKSSHYSPKKTTWFRIADVQDFDIYPVNPRVGDGGRIWADCEVSFVVPSQAFIFKKIIKTRMLCLKIKLMDGTLDWNEPGQIALIRNLVTQTYINAVNEETAYWQGRLYELESSVCSQAICALMLNGSATRHDVQRRFEQLTPVYKDDPEEFQLLCKYYQALMEVL